MNPIRVFGVQKPCPLSYLFTARTSLWACCDFTFGFSFSPIPQIHILCLLITQLCCLHLRDSLSLAALSAATLLPASEDQHADPTRISSYYTFPNTKRDIRNRLQLATETYSSIHNGRVQKTNPSPTLRPETMRGTSAHERLCSALSPNPRAEDSAVQLE